MMEQTPKKRRRAYLDDFRRDAAGSFVFCGKHMAFCGDGAAYRRFRLSLLSCCLLLLGFEIVNGCLNVEKLDNTMLVLIPYMLQIVFAAAFLWSAFRLCFGGDPLRDYVYRQTVCRLPALALLLAVCSGATGVCASIGLLLQKSASFVQILYTILFFAIGAAALFGMALIRKTDWEER